MKTTLDERFWAKVDRNGPIYADLGTQCWLWTGFIDIGGYGIFRLDGISRAAHRLSYEWSTGELLGSLLCDHRCHVHACVNPSHLRPATHKQNAEHRRGARRDSKSGVRGVFWDASKGRWRAEVGHNNEVIRLGRFRTIEEAEAVVVAKRLELFTHNDADRMGHTDSR
jgi:hypothetical protein